MPKKITKSAGWWSDSGACSISD